MTWGRAAADYTAQQPVVIAEPAAAPGEQPARACRRGPSGGGQPGVASLSVAGLAHDRLGLLCDPASGAVLPGHEDDTAR